jgi:hypothetical protein
MQWVRREGVVGGKEEERDQQTRQSYGIANLHDSFSLIVRGQEFIVEEAVKKVPDEYFELALLALRSDGLSLGA